VRGVCRSISSTEYQPEPSLRRVSWLIALVIRSQSSIHVIDRLGAYSLEPEQKPGRRRAWLERHAAVASTANQVRVALGMRATYIHQDNGSICKGTGNCVSVILAAV
jgi:hypothetical protein